MSIFGTSRRSGFADWNKVVIGEENPSPEFAVIKAPELSPAVLREAVARLKFPVVNVQIEIPVSQELKDFVGGLDNKKLFYLSHLPFGRKERTVFNAVNFMKTAFNKQDRLYRDDPQSLYLLEQWRKIAVAMPLSVGTVWSQVGTVSILAKENPSYPFGSLRPHDHPGTGYMLNFAGAADGTVFIDEEKRLLSFGKGWSYNLFAQSGRADVKGAMHSEPFPFQSPGIEQRKTFIIDIKPG